MYIALYLAACTQAQLLMAGDLAVHHSHDLCVSANDRSFDATAFADHYLACTIQLAFYQTIDAIIAVGGNVSYNLASIGT